MQNYFSILEVHNRCKSSLSESSRTTSHGLLPNHLFNQDTRYVLLKTDPRPSNPCHDPC